MKWLTTLSKGDKVFFRGEVQVISKITPALIVLASGEKFVRSDGTQFGCRVMGDMLPALEPWSAEVEQSKVDAAEYADLVKEFRKLDPETLDAGQLAHMLSIAFGGFE